MATTCGHALRVPTSFGTWSLQPRRTKFSSQTSIDNLLQPARVYLLSFFSVTKVQTHTILSHPSNHLSLSLMFDKLGGDPSDLKSWGTAAVSDRVSVFLVHAQESEICELFALLL